MGARMVWVGGLVVLLAASAARGADAGPAGAEAASGVKRPESGEAPSSPEAAKGPTASGEAEAARRTLFAAPMENATGKEQYDPVAAGLGDLVTVLLAQQEQITVVDRMRLDAVLKEQALALKGLTGEKYAVQAGKLLKADTVIVGRLFLAEGKPRVSMKAVEISTARVAAAGEMSCRPEDVLEAALEMARKLASQMAMPLPEIDLRNVDKSPIAGLHYAKALSHYYAGDMDSALMQFMRTMDLDPDYVDSHYWSGLCYRRLGEAGHAVIEWEKFLKRSPGSPRAAAVRKLVAEAKAQEAATRGGEPLGPKDEAGKDAAKQAH